jgi:hypothetical protein
LDLEARKQGEGKEAQEIFPELWESAMDAFEK